MPQKKRSKVLKGLRTRTLKELNTGHIIYFQGDETFEKEGWVNFITSDGVVAVDTYRNHFRKGLITKLHCSPEQAVRLEKEGIINFPRPKKK